jgi:hypothetical protein
MLLAGATLQPRTLSEGDVEEMKKNTYQERSRFTSTDSPRERYNFRHNRNTQTQGNNGMEWSSTPTPGIPPSNAQASEWYKETSFSGSQPVSNASHTSGIMRLDDLRAEFGPREGRREDRGGYQGYHNRGGRSGNGYYQGQYSGSGGYRDSRRW